MRIVKSIIASCFMFAPSVWAVDTDFEARCAEIDAVGGQTCECSETLDWSGTVTSIPDGYNPPGSSTFECGYPEVTGQAFGHSKTNPQDGFTFRIITDADPMPAGSTVSYVFGVPSETASFNVRGVRRNNVTDETHCFRIYMNFEANFPAPDGVNDRLKGGRIKGGGAGWEQNLGIEWNWGSDCTNCTKTLAGSNNGGWHPDGGDTKVPVTDGSPSASAGSVALDDCRSGWCYQEMCFDHDPPGCTNCLNQRARLVHLNSGDFVEWEGLANDLAAAPQSQSNMDVGFNTWIMDGFTQGTMESGHFQFISHAMHASVSPSDPTFWIGAACEVEGGCGGGGGGGPTPSMSGGSISGGVVR